VLFRSAHPGALRAPGAADQRRRASADAARVRLLRRRGVRAQPRSDHGGGCGVLRSEERRGGKGCRSRGSPCDEQKKYIKSGVIYQEQNQHKN